jgi:hypothetical protein
MKPASGLGTRRWIRPRPSVSSRAGVGRRTPAGPVTIPAPDTAVVAALEATITALEPAITTLESPVTAFEPAASIAEAAVPVAEVPVGISRVRLRPSLQPRPVGGRIPVGRSQIVRPYGTELAEPFLGGWLVAICVVLPPVGGFTAEPHFCRHSPTSNHRPA